MKELTLETTRSLVKAGCITLAGMSALLLGARSGLAQDRLLFDTTRCNLGLHERYDAFLAPYREVGSPALPPGVLVVGGPAGPSELFIPSGNSTAAYDVVYVINNGRILFTGQEEPPATIASKIVLLDHAELLAWDANLHFEDRDIPTDPNDVLDAAGEGTVMIEAGDDALINIFFSRVSIGDTNPGYLRFVACGFSTTVLAFNDFSTQQDTCTVARTRPTTEVFPFAFDNATVTIVEEAGSQSALYEVSAGGNGTINLFDLDDPGAGAYFIVDAEVIEPVRDRKIVLSDQSYRLEDVAGNGPTINAVNSGLLWGFWLERGANLAVENSQVGLWFKIDGDAELEGLSSGLWGEGGAPRTVSLPDQNIQVSLVDTHVVETNTYFRGGGTKWLRHAVVGDANCGGFGTCIISESVVTGTGGDYSTVFGNAVSIYGFSAHRLGLFARDNGLAIFHYSTIESHPESPAPNRFRASDQALISFQNAVFAPPRSYPDSICQGVDLGELRCEVESDGAIAYANILSPGFGSVVSTSQNVIGTAAVTSNANSPWAFHHYDLWLEAPDGSTEVLVREATVPIAAPESPFCRAGADALGVLDVTGLTPGGLYKLHLAVYGQVGWPVAQTENAFVFSP